MDIEYDKRSDLYDVCIIGSGPAGIILALEFAKDNPLKTVVLVEYGEKNKEKNNTLDDSIENRNPLNHHSPYECTNKGFGGTSATWGGRCVMYDEIDFLQRPIINKECTWDVNLFHEIQKFLPRTTSYFECGKSIFDLNKIPKFTDLRIAENFKEGVITDSVIERWSMPTRFADRYKKEIESLGNITLLTGYEARDISLLNNDGIISSIVIRKNKTKELKKIIGKSFVLAAGAQEITRILLRNTQVFNILGMTPPSLGRFYQGHLSGKIASVNFYGDAKKTDFGFLRNSDGSYIRRRFQFTTDFLKEHNLLNTAIWLDNPLYYDPKHRSGAMSLMYLAMITPILGKKLAPPAIAHSITKGKTFKIRKHLINIIKDFPSSFFIPATIFYKRYLRKRKLPGIFLFSPQNSYALHFHSEQIPTFDSKIELDPDGETLIIDYSISDNDINSVIKLHKILDQYLQDNKCGKLEYWFDESKLASGIRTMSKDGIHQSGTTRIANSPELGVVDTDLKVFGTTNLFVCSSSVFPTSGQANPTFMLGAFSIRLAKHLTKIHEKN